MRAAVIRAPGTAAVELSPVPEVSAGEVLVRIEGCGVCASSDPVWEGRDWFSYPQPAGAPGHEPWGQIVSAGSGVTSLRTGQRVAILTDRGFAEYAAVPEHAAIPLPAELDGKPFPGEAIGCAMNIFGRSGIEAGHLVAVIGAGFLGTLLVRLAKNAGARVIALSRRQFARELASTYGADETIPLDDHSRIIERVRELSSGRFCDRVIEVAGKQWPLDLAGELTRERGRLVIAGYHQDGPRQVNMQLWNWRGLDVVNAHERDPLVYADGIRRAIAAVVSGAIDPAPLYTHILPLEDLGSALDLLQHRPAGFVKALVTL